MVKIVREKVYGLRKENSLELHLGTYCTGREVATKEETRESHLKGFILPEGSPVRY